MSAGCFWRAQEKSGWGQCPLAPLRPSPDISFNTSIIYFYLETLIPRCSHILISHPTPYLYTLNMPSTPKPPRTLMSSHPLTIFISSHSSCLHIIISSVISLLMKASSLWFLSQPRPVVSASSTKTDQSEMITVSFSLLSECSPVPCVFYPVVRHAKQVSTLHCLDTD